MSGELVTMGTFDALYEAMQAKPSQVVTHSARAHLAGIKAQECTQVLTQVAVGEAAGQKRKQ